MANLKNRTDKNYVAKVSKRNNTVEFLSVSTISGAISYRPDMESGHFDESAQASRAANHLNNFYEEVGLEIFCYRVASAETNTHTINNAPAEYRDIVRAYYGQLETPEEEAPTEEPTE